MGIITANPFQFTSKLLGKQRPGRLKCQREEVEEHLMEKHSDPEREDELRPCDKFLDPEQPSTPVDDSEPKVNEVRETIKRARAASAPGPNGVPYKVYKSWMVAEGCFIPKEENSEAIKQFETISLLNVEGKVFLAILARMMTYMLANKYIECHRYICTEWRHTRSVRVLGAYKC